jgi:hypothetical protein
MAHKCCEGFKLSNYPEFASYISTCAESLNNFLQLYHSQVAYMKQDTFITVIMFAIGIRNWLMNKKLEEIISKFKLNK